MWLWLFAVPVGMFAVILAMGALEQRVLAPLDDTKPRID